MKTNDLNVAISAQIAEEYKLRPVERLVYEKIRAFKDNSTHIAYPSINAIAEGLSCCRNTAKKYINQLVEKGLISITERPIVLPNGKKWNDTHIYTFVAEKYGEARIQSERNSKEQAETGYQKVKREFFSAKQSLSKEHDPALCETAFSHALKNIRSGATKHILKPLSYMKRIVVDLEEKRAEAKSQLKLANDPDVLALEEKLIDPSKNIKSLSKPEIRKTRRKSSFHNFEQRSSKYTNEEIEKLLSEKHKL